MLANAGQCWPVIRSRPVLRMREVHDGLTAIAGALTRRGHADPRSWPGFQLGFQTNLRSFFTIARSGGY
jgi:hypothetical protein